ncbi:hypothetical protein KI387_005884, partial [Taxus chinensis]
LIEIIDEEKIRTSHLSPKGGKILHWPFGLLAFDQSLMIKRVGRGVASTSSVEQRFINVVGHQRDVSYIYEYKMVKVDGHASRMFIIHVTTYKVFKSIASWARKLVGSHRETSYE